MVFFARDAQLLLQLSCCCLCTLSCTPPRVNFSSCVSELVLNVFTLCCCYARSITQRLYLLDQFSLASFGLGVLKLKSAQSSLDTLEDVELRL